MRDLVYYVATSLDGYIAREDGSFSDFPWDDRFGATLLETYPETFPAHLRDRDATRADNRVFDTVLMGRATYEVGLREGITNPYPTLDQHVFSRTMPASPDPAVTLVSAHAVEAVRDLKQQPGKAVWLCGGGALAGSLHAAGLIDQWIVKLHPVVFGTGIPLLAGITGAHALEPVDHQIFDSGHAIVRYRTRREA